MFTGLRVALHLNATKSFEAEKIVMVRSKKELTALPVGSWIQENSASRIHLYDGGLIKDDSGLYEKRNGAFKIASQVKLPAKVLFSE